MRLARLAAEHQALTALIPANPEREQRDAERHRDHVRLNLAALDREHTDAIWADTPLGDALRAWKAVHHQRTAAERHAHEGPWLRRPGFARAAREAAEWEAPIEAAYRALATAERQRLVPELAQAEAAAAELAAQVLDHRRFLRIEHPEVPRRVTWIEREMESLADEVFDTRMGLENAMGQGWEHADPTWADRGYRPEGPGVGTTASWGCCVTSPSNGRAQSSRLRARPGTGAVEGPLQKINRIRFVRKIPPAFPVEFEIWGVSSRDGPSVPVPDGDWPGGEFLVSPGIGTSSSRGTSPPVVDGRRPVPLVFIMRKYPLVSRDISDLERILK